MSIVAGVPQVQTKTYNGYFFGSPSSTITSPEQCTIARGYSGTDADYGQSVRVEANVAYDVNSTQTHANLMKADTDELVRLQRSAAYSCFDTKNGNPKLKAYWGGNSLLRVAIPGYDIANVMNTQIVSDIQGFSEPIFDLSGMKETSRLSNPSIADCQGSKYQYALLAPYTYNYTYTESLEVDRTYNCTTGWPKEWNTGGSCADSLGPTPPRYSCLTEHELLPKIPTLAESMSDYTTQSCLVGSVFLDGKAVQTSANSCIRETGTVDSPSSVDDTLYEDRYYHSIPSLAKHISPTSAEISAAESNGATPSLPVDIVRSFEFLTPKGNIARLQYPDFFSAPATDLVTMRRWLKSFSEVQWRAILTTEVKTVITPEQVSVARFFPSNPLPLAPFDWNSLISDAALEKVIQAKKWIHPDITEKAKKIVESSLSYSHQYDKSDITKNIPLLPESGLGYDIAFLGLSSLTPLGEY